jgi:hypothetical protein
MTSNSRLGIVIRTCSVVMVAALLAIGSAFVATASERNGTPARQLTAENAPSPVTAPSAAANIALAEAPESEAPESEAPARSDPGPPTEGAPSAGDLSHALNQLAAAGVPANAAQFAAFARTVGVGGAVRVYGFARLSGRSPADVLAMFTGGMGWGEIARQLKISGGPGIGWIMRAGHGNSGQTKGKDHPTP